MNTDYALHMGAMATLTFPLTTLARAIDTANALQHTQSMDNFNNLLQVPTLFFVLCLALVQSDTHHTVYGMLLWLYVLLRVGHNSIPLTYNHVRHRARVWIASNLALRLGWALFVIHQVNR